MALGASRRAVLWLVLRDSLMLMGIGIAGGLALAVLMAMAIAGDRLPLEPVRSRGSPVLWRSASTLPRGPLM